MNEIKHVTDDMHNIHKITKELSSGGQGIVYHTKDRDVLVKIAINPATRELLTSKDIILKNQKIYENIKLLPIPKEANITFPITLLQNVSGYVMQFLNEMIPISELLILDKEIEKIKENDIPEWLNETDEDLSKIILAYINTGGLRKRLQVLYKTAIQLSLLHRSGLVFCDLSHNNILISNNKDEDVNVWFIDSDNLMFEGNKCDFYTDGYGAPEFLQNKTTHTMATDCHSFAVLAYRILAVTHPLLGNLADPAKMDWANPEANPIREAYEGAYPWIGDKNDDSNESYDGLQAIVDHLIYDELFNLFDLTFTEGRLDYKKRPPIYNWPFAFAKALDNTIKCLSCNMSFHYNDKNENGEEKCPYCNTVKPITLIMESYSYGENGIEELQWVFTHEIKTGSSIKIPARVFTITNLIKTDLPVLEILFEKNAIQFTNNDNFDINIYIEYSNINKDKFEELIIPRRIRTDWKKSKSNEPSFYIYSCDNLLSRIILCSIKEHSNEIG